MESVIQPDEGMISCELNFKPALYDALAHHCKATGRSASDIMEGALALYLMQNNTDNTSATYRASARLYLDHLFAVNSEAIGS